jgi:hypothetical protein
MSFDNGIAVIYNQKVFLSEIKKAKGVKWLK